jgi:hypothetical protein
MTIVTSTPIAHNAQHRQQQYADSSYGASCSSYYTTEEKKDFYDGLEAILSTKCSDPQVRQVIRDLLQVCADITLALRTALVTVEGSTNDFGDTQLSVDVSLFWSHWTTTNVDKDDFLYTVHTFCKIILTLIFLFADETGHCRQAIVGCRQEFFRDS